MYARKIGEVWEALAPAKLNLYLDVLGRRDDGFHELETLLAPIRLYDRLEWRPAADSAAPFSLSYDPAVSARVAELAPPDERNLVWRAIELLAQSAGCRSHGAFTLTKRIPIQAGLGGGSSDAAAALVLANAAWGVDYSISQLGDLAAQLGSDVPFFLAGQSAVCRGRGERVEPLAAMPRLDLVVVAPRAGVSTAAAFQKLDAPHWKPAASATAEAPSERLSHLLEVWRRGAVNGAAQLMTNSLQGVAIELCPVLERIGTLFARLGCHAHQLTGSGSAYFGVMRSARHARRAASILASANLGTVFATATCR